MSPPSAAPSRKASRIVVRVLVRLVYAGALVTCFGVAGYASFKLFVRSGVTTAPDLVGKTEAEAARVLADQGLVLRRAEGGGRFDPEIPAGAVLVQEPAARTLVKRGSPVEVVLSLGPERLTVPELAGRGLPAAQVTLAAAGLTLGRTLQIYSDRDRGTVVEQAPAPGSSVAPMASVDLLLSRGDTSATYLMPDLVYRDYDRVRTFFVDRGFRFGSVKFERYEGARPGIILRQFPLPGHPLTRRDAVSLVVAAPTDTDRQEPSPLDDR
jgi:beta-lactam-binding protein with PASTA domain